VTAASELIRIVMSPEGQLVPDLKGRLPGRGAYVCSQRRCVDQAVRRRALARALKAAVSPSETEGLADKIAELLAQRALSLLGVLRKGKRVIVGRDSIRSELKRGQIHLLVTACDVEDNLFGQGAEALVARSPFSRERLGHAVGKGPQPVLAVLDEKGSREMRRWIDRMKGLESGRE
jgi:predicted RNA-binding protein YlxR (DUF448 family)